MLFQPFQLKHLTLKNRIMITSHEPSYGQDGMPKDRYRAYHVERAKAGIAMTMTAGSASVSRDSQPVFNNLLAYKDEVVPWLKAMTDEVHEHDCAVMIQLSHLGRRTGWDTGHWLPSVAPTRRREPAHMYGAKLIETWDIDRIVRDYADAAERMKAGGVDGIELEAYGHLVDQFFSPLTNDLENEYGGSLENRSRFIHRVVDAIRDRIGAEFILGIRMVVDEVQDGGLNRGEGIAIAKSLKDSGKIDYINVIRGRIHTDAALTDVIPVQGMRSSPHLDFAGSVKAELGMPTFHASKIADLATARHAILEGLLDMVGMTRAHIADPHIVRKLLSGAEADIRPCVGATYCLDRIYEGGAALCIHNPSTGRELEQPHDIEPATEKKKVIIIGAGPAGLEAARVAGARGHKVVVYEAGPKAGGQVLLAARSKRRRELIGIIDWRLEQCAKYDVEFRYNNFVEATDIIEEIRDIVIVATGGMPEMVDIDDADILAVSAWDVLTGDVKPGDNVLIYDETGDHTGLQTAELLTDAGAAVEMITPDRSISRDVPGMNLVPYLRSLQSKDIVFTPGRRLMAISKDGNQLKAKIGTDYSEYVFQKAYDQIVVNQGIIPLDDIYMALKPYSKNLGVVDYRAFIDGRPQSVEDNSDGAFKLFRIGDAVSARNIHAAIYDALRLVRQI